SYVDYKHSIDHSKDRVVVLPRTLPPPLTSHPLTHQFTVRVSSDDPVSDRVSVIKRVKEDMSHTNPLFHTNSTFGLWQTRVSREWKEMWSMTQAYHGTAETRRIYTPEKLDTPPCPTKNCYYCAVCQLYIDDAKRLLSVEEFNHLKPTIVDHVASVFHQVNCVSTTNTTRLADTLLISQQPSSNHKRKRDDGDSKLISHAPEAAAGAGEESHKRRKLETPSLASASSSSSSKDEKKSENKSRLLTLLLLRHMNPRLALDPVKLESLIFQEFKESYTFPTIQKVSEALGAHLLETFEFVFIPLAQRKQPSASLVSESLYLSDVNHKRIIDTDMVDVGDMLKLGAIVHDLPGIVWLDLKESGIEWKNLCEIELPLKQFESKITDIIEPLTASDYSHLPSAASHISRDLHHSIMTEGSC